MSAEAGEAVTLNLSVEDGEIRADVQPVVPEVPAAAAAATASPASPRPMDTQQNVSIHHLEALLRSAVDRATGPLKDELLMLRSSVHVMSDVKAREADLSAIGNSSDRNVQARALELKVYHHAASTALSQLGWLEGQMGASFPPQLQAVKDTLQALFRMVLLQLGALELVGAKGWGLYNAYTQAMRPYAANPPTKWQGYDWRVVDRKQLALCEQVQVHSPQARAGPSTSYSGRRSSRPSNGSQRPSKQPRSEADKA